MIGNCAFGSMAVGDRVYTSDLLIFPDGRVVDQWWRASGHRLTLPDIAGLVEAGPEIIVAGMGVYGRMKADADLKAALAQRGIELITARNKSAAKAFNAAIQKQQRVAGCFHLTC